MDILYLLIPVSALLVLAILGVFAWASHAGQFDDVEAEGRRILAPDADPVDSDQPPGAPAAREYEVDQPTRSIVRQEGAPR
jgi:cbb3-type cytochrome oxidase maturation protein